MIGQSVQSDLERQFHLAILDIYRIAKAKLNYTASYFLRMVGEQGGVQAALTLLHAPAVSDGFTRLHISRRLDLSVEAYVLRSEFVGLFSEEERAIARRRLQEVGCDATGRPMPRVQRVRSARSLTDQTF